MWLRQIEDAKAQVKLLSHVHITKLGEQRNLFTILMSVFTMVVLPFNLATKYWSQNFENMSELSRKEVYPFSAFSGVNLFWVSQGIIYLIVVLIMIHSRILFIPT